MEKITRFAFVIALLIGLATKSHANGLNTYLAADATLAQNKKALCQVLLRGEHVGNQVAGGVKVTGRNWRFVGSLYHMETIPTKDGTLKIKFVLYGKLQVNKSVALCQATFKASQPRLGQATVALRLEGVRRYAGVAYFDTREETQIVRGFFVIKQTR